MSGGAVLDNDVLIKVCAYSVAAAASDHLKTEFGVVFLLSVLRFVVPKQLNKSRRICDRKAAQAQFEEFLNAAKLIEPTAEEIELAAELETQAQSRALPLDIGESQCVAVALLRSADAFLTGDKRALGALAMLRAAGELPEAINGRTASVEQLMLSLLGRIGHSELRKRVCREPGADTALRLVFSCSSSKVEGEHIEGALISYINHLRQETGAVLWKSDRLSVIS